MLSVAAERHPWPYRAMVPQPTDAPEVAERKLYGRALKLLRERAEMSQPQAADALGVTLTAWQNYEAGKRQWKPRLLRDTTKAVNATVEDLELLRARLSDEPDLPAAQAMAGFRERPSPSFQIPIHGRARMGPMGANVYDVGEPEGVIDLASLIGADTRALRLAGESMIPYAEPGGFVLYQLNRWPGRGKGCVIETNAGEYYVKRYDKSDGAAIYATELWPEERQLRFETKDLKGVYAIMLRGD